jgi:DNA-binding XRE family transcriptional regulator
MIIATILGDIFLNCQFWVDLIGTEVIKLVSAKQTRANTVMLVKVKVNTKGLWAAVARQNLSQNEMAAKLGISKCYMSQVLSGTRCPSPKLRRRMLEVLSPLTFDDLFIIEENGGDHQS